MCIKLGYEFYNIHQFCNGTKKGQEFENVHQFCKWATMKPSRAMCSTKSIDFVIGQRDREVP